MAILINALPITVQTVTMNFGPAPITVEAV